MPKAFRNTLTSSLLILLFVYTAVSKIISFKQFTNVLSVSPLISRYAFFLAPLVIIVELLVSLLLFVPKSRRIGFIASIFLLTGFTLYIGYMLLAVPHLPCSCGGVVQLMTWRQHLVFNLFFLLLALVGYQSTMTSIHSWDARIPYPTQEDIL